MPRIRIRRKVTEIESDDSSEAKTETSKSEETKTEDNPAFEAAFEQLKLEPREPRSRRESRESPEPPRRNRESREPDFSPPRREDRREEFRPEPIRRHTVDNHGRYARKRRTDTVRSQHEQGKLHYSTHYGRDGSSLHQSEKTRILYAQAFGPYA